MATRLQSPSSINTFKQCKRKYFYQYIEKLPTVPNIHQVRGNIVHSALENFFDIDTSSFTQENYMLEIRKYIQKFCFDEWSKEKTRLNALGLSKDKERFYFEESMLMLLNWTNHFLKDMKEMMEKKQLSIQEAFVKLTPIREKKYKSEEHNVRGFIDAIQHVEEEVHIIDYKTNSSFQMKDSIKLQLAIYSLLYYELHGKMPDKVGIFFLRNRLKMMNVDEELLKLARLEIELIHAHTGSTESVVDYPRTITPLCKWRTGKCDFYSTCKPHN